MHACSAINLDVSNNSMLHALKLAVYFVRRLEITWIMSNIADIVNITTANWYVLAMLVFNVNSPMCNIS